MTEEEKLRKALEAARAKFHGLSCAVALHLAGGDKISLVKLLQSLRDGNLACAIALGYRPDLEEGAAHDVLASKGNQPG